MQIQMRLRSHLSLTQTVHDQIIKSGHLPFQIFVRMEKREFQTPLKQFLKGRLAVFPFGTTRVFGRYFSSLASQGHGTAHGLEEGFRIIPRTCSDSFQGLFRRTLDSIHFFLFFHGTGGEWPLANFRKGKPASFPLFRRKGWIFHGAKKTQPVAVRPFISNRKDTRIASPWEPGRIQLQKRISHETFAIFRHAPSGFPLQDCGWTGSCPHIHKKPCRHAVRSFQ